MRVLAFFNGAWRLLFEGPPGADRYIEFSMPAEFFQDQEGKPLALPASVVKIEFYQGSKPLNTEELPLNVDCPEQFCGRYMAAPQLSSLDARIAQAGAAVTKTYREYVRWLEKLRGSKGGSLKVTKFQANLDQFFRHVHIGLRGERERLEKNARSLFTVRHTLLDLSKWLKEVMTADAALPSDECRSFLIERLAEEVAGLLRLSNQHIALQSPMRKALDDTGVHEALDTALTWVRARDGDDVEEFQRQTVRRFAMRRMP